MTPHSDPPLETPPRPRSPWQRLYAAGHRLRRGWYRRRSRRLSRPVVSVGNLHWGGTGKTPLAAAIAAHLRDRGLAVAILSRGYGREGGDVRVVSTGDGPLLGPTLAGDEPVLLAGALPGVSVVVGADRFEAGLHALERLDPPPDLFLLDDGFSHLALERDLDLVALPSFDPYGGGRLPPSGRLREPLSSLDRADAVLLTGGEGDLGQALAASLAPHGFTGRGFVCPRRYEPARTEHGEPLEPGGPSGARVLVVSAIARPESFIQAVEAAGFEIAGREIFPDHHPYPQKSLERIARALERSGADWVLTTAKDQVKLLGRLDRPLAELPMHLEPEPAFWIWLAGKLEEIGVEATE